MNWVHSTQKHFHLLSVELNSNWGKGETMPKWESNDPPWSPIATATANQRLWSHPTCWRYINKIIIIIIIYMAH